MLLIGGHDLAATGNLAVEEIGFATVVTIPGFVKEAFASVVEVPLLEI